LSKILPRQLEGERFHPEKGDTVGRSRFIVRREGEGTIASPEEKKNLLWARGRKEVASGREGIEKGGRLMSDRKKGRRSRPEKKTTVLVNKKDPGAQQKRLRVFRAEEGEEGFWQKHP